MSSQDRTPQGRLNNSQSRFETPPEQQQGNLQIILKDSFIEAPFSGNIEYGDEILYEENEEDINIDNVDIEVEVDSQHDDWEVGRKPESSTMAERRPPKQILGVVRFFCV